MTYQPYGLIEHGAHNGIGICPACEQRMLDEDAKKRMVEDDPAVIAANTLSNAALVEAARNTTNDDPVAVLNQYKIHIGNLRMFLASLSQDGFEEIPLGSLMSAVKTFARKEG